MGDGAVFLGVGLEREEDVGLGAVAFSNIEKQTTKSAAVIAASQAVGVGEVAQRVDAEEDQAVELAVDSSAARISSVGLREPLPGVALEARAGVGQAAGLAQAAGVGEVGDFEQAGAVGARRCPSASARSSRARGAVAVAGDRARPR